MLEVKHIHRSRQVAGDESTESHGNTEEGLTEQWVFQLSVSHKYPCASPTWESLGYIDHSPCPPGACADVGQTHSSLRRTTQGSESET